LVTAFMGNRSSENRLSGLPTVKHESDLWPDDILFVTHRDPLARFVSAVCDKLIARRGAEDLWRSTWARMGPEAGRARLEDWVDTMLAPDPGAADPHFRPQALHLFPRPYHHHPDVTELAIWGVQTLGPAKAAWLFQRQNARESGLFRLPPGPTPGLDTLQALHRMHHAFPHPEDLISTSLRQRLARIYADDQSMRAAWGYDSSL
jgi:hypothetical protein